MRQIGKAHRVQGLVWGLAWLVVVAALPVRAAAERAVWVWGQEAFRMLEEPTYRDEVFDFFNARQVTSVFLFTDPDTFQGGRSVLDEGTGLEDMIEEMHDLGWSVFALSGSDPHFALRQNQEGAIALADRVFSYNHTHRSVQRFDGLVIDVEPWFLPEWEADRAAVAEQYLEMAEAYMDLKGQYASQIPVGAATVSWFDTIELSRGGLTRPLNQHVQDIFDYVAVLAFRDFALGTDGMVEQVAAELAYAESQGRSIIVGVETQEALGEGDAIADLATFFQEGELRLEESLAQAEAEWAGSAAFWSFAIHHLGSYKIWTERPFFHALQPIGSMVYAAQDVLGQVTETARFIAYPVELRQGQRLSVAVEALDGGLAPIVVVTRSADGRAWEASAGPGGAAQLPLVEALDGNHTVTVSGGGSTGSYAIALRVNAAFEDERFGGVANDGPNSAQALDFVPLTPVAAGPAAATQGDFDSSGRVDFADFFLFVEAFGSGQALYDLDSSGRVDFADFFLFAEGFDTLVENYSGWDSPAQRAAVAGYLNQGDAVDWYAFEQGVAGDAMVLLKPARGHGLIFAGQLELSLYDRDSQILYEGRLVRSDTPFGQGLFADDLPAGRYSVEVSGTAGSQYELVLLKDAGFVLDPHIRQSAATPWVVGALEEEAIEFDFFLSADEVVTVDIAAPRAAAPPGLGLEAVEVDLVRLADNSSAELLAPPQIVPLEEGETGRRFRFQTLFRGRYVMRVLSAGQSGVVVLRVQRD